MLFPEQVQVPPTLVETSVNVLEHGVVGDGVHDDVVAINALIASKTTLYFPPNRTYLLRSLTHVDYPQYDDAAICIHGVEGLRVIAVGATFKVDASSALSQAVFVDRSIDVEWLGGEILGSRSGLGANQENVAIGLTNNKQISISFVSIRGFSGAGAGIAGDWNYNVNLHGLNFYGVGIGLDLAFINKLQIDDSKAVGEGAVAGQPGQKFFSVIYDGPLAGDNRVGLSFEDSGDIVASNNDVSHFNTGFAIASGHGYVFRKNRIHDLVSQRAKAQGYYFFQIESGRFTSRYGRPTGIIVEDDASVDR